jgi:hypothetical protein
MKEERKTNWIKKKEAEREIFPVFTGSFSFPVLIHTESCCDQNTQKSLHV